MKSKLYSSAYTIIDPTSIYRFLSLRQQVELDSIPGMVFCPRTTCGFRIISEPDSDLAVCQTCGFPFCKQCRQTWHGIESCPVFEKVRQDNLIMNDCILTYHR